MTAPSVLPEARRRLRRADAATTTAPGATAISARTPNAVDAAIPVAAPSPAAANAHAAAPSRGPHPADAERNRPGEDGDQSDRDEALRGCLDADGDAGHDEGRHERPDREDGRGDHGDHGANGPERRAKGRQLSADPGSQARTQCRRDGQSDAGDGDREEHDAHSGSVGRHPERHQHHAREQRAAPPARPCVPRRRRATPEGCDSRCARARLLDARRRPPRPAAPSSGTATGSTRPPTLPRRAAVRGGRRASAIATRPRSCRQPRGASAARTAAGAAATEVSPRRKGSPPTSADDGREDAGSDRGAQIGAESRRRRHRPHAPRLPRRRHGGHAKRSRCRTTTRSSPAASCARRVSLILVRPLLAAPGAPPRPRRASLPATRRRARAPSRPAARASHRVRTVHPAASKSSITMVTASGPRSRRPSTVRR